MIYHCSALLVISLTSSYAGRIARSTDQRPHMDHTKGPFKELNPDWMKYLPNDEKLISEVTIPGTHNSLALYGWLYYTTNSKSCREQLEGGIRYFDPRPRNYGNGSLPLHHASQYMKQDLTDVFQCVSDFLNDYPSEFVIFRIKEEFRPKLSDPMPFQSAVYDAVLPYAASGKLLNVSYIPTIEQARGKMFILENYYSHGKKVGYPYSRARIQDQHDMFSVSDEDVDKKWDAIYKHLQKIKFGRPPFPLFINHLTANGILAPPHLSSAKLNLRMLRWLQSNLGMQKLGIIPMDFPGSELIKSLIMTNGLAADRTVESFQRD